MGEYYVYCYKNPIDGSLFYIGKGKKDRCYHHLKGNRENKRFNNYIKSLINSNIFPIIEKIEENLSENKAYELEESLIKKYGRKDIDTNGILLNICNSARPPSRKGISPSIETRAKMSKSRKGKNHHFYNKSFSKEHRKNIANGLKGRKLSKQTIQKRTDSVSKTWKVTTPEGKEILIKNLCDFCRSNKLNPSHMRSIALGERKTHKGYKCSYNNIDDRKIYKKSK